MWTETLIMRKQILWVWYRDLRGSSSGQQGRVKCSCNAEKVIEWQKREEIKAGGRRCESSCLVVFLVDKRTAVLMMADTFRVGGYSDWQFRPGIGTASGLTAMTDRRRDDRWLDVRTKEGNWEVLVCSVGQSAGLRMKMMMTSEFFLNLFFFIRHTQFDQLARLNNNIRLNIYRNSACSSGRSDSSNSTGHSDGVKEQL